MKRNHFIVGGTVLLLVITGVLVVSTRKPAPEKANAQVQAEETKPLGIPVSTAADATLPEGASAAEVYEKLSTEIQALAQRAMNATSPEEQEGLFDQIAGKFRAFRAKYPDTPEANDAAFQLGAMSFSMQRVDEAEKLLTDYVARAGDSDRQKVAYSHFYLAECYKALGKFDKAESEYKLVLSRYSDVNQRLTTYTQSNLAGLDSERKTAVGAEPIAFSVTSIKGETLSPGQYKGKVLLIDFWATWCGPCVAEMPNVKSVYEKYHPKGFEIVGISLDQSRERLDDYLKQQSIPWPQYFDGKWWNNDVARMYGVQSIPSTLLVDREGKIRYRSLRGKQLEAAVEKLIAESS